MVAPLRLDPAEAQRRFGHACQLVARHSQLPSLRATLQSLERSLQIAFDGRARLLESARLVDQAALDRELKDALRRVGPAGPGVDALRRRRQSAIAVQDELDAVDEHIHQTVLDVEALAAQLQASTARLEGEGAEEIGSRLQGELAQLKADAAALESARRELEGL